MGVQGFKRTLQDRYSKAVQMTRVRKVSIEVDYLYVDMNSVLHGCIQNKGTEETMREVIESLDILFEMATPKTHLVLAVDGPAPWAKIPLQRGRRRQVALTTRPSTLVTKLDLTPGTMFMEKLTDALVTWAAVKMEDCDELKVTVNGSGVPGEGEAKIFEAMNTDVTYCNGEERKATDETFCIIGNDTDLVLGCLAMTRAVNLTVIDSQTGFTVSIPDLIGTWLCDPPNPNPTQAKDFIHNTAALPSARMAFAVISTFAGNDYLPALEGIDSFNVWTSYAKLLTSGKVAGLTTGNGACLDHQTLGQVLAAAMQDMARAPPTGREDTESVPAYLQGLMWVMASLCGQGCTDYSWVYPRNWAGPHVNAVITWCKKAGKKKIMAQVEKTSNAVVPMKYLACVLPTEAWWMLPEKIAELTKQVKKRKRSDEEIVVALSTLEGSAEAGAIVDAVDTVFNMAEVKSSRLRLQLPYRITKIKAGSAAGKKAKVATGVRASAKQWGAVNVVQQHLGTTSMAVDDKQPDVALTLFNPFTGVEAPLPEPVSYSAKGKKKPKKTGLNLSSNVEMDIEV
eukprot:TRINITY_DN8072_c0_g1_i1.p1 TRINITY_DN8072_c0_g1~~TRINITY_DN8072_c0_g1_i1.p1  ORF type:complete len:567 (+),score=161.99 TRINITY_DN8072_c0_g1_i1:42-1742(+)